MIGRNLWGAACVAAFLCAGAMPASSQSAAENTAPGPGFAPNGAIETVVVTARRRAEDVEKIPVAVTAITGEKLRQTQTNSAMALQYLAPSLSVAASLGSRD